MHGTKKLQLLIIDVLASSPVFTTGVTMYHKLGQMRTIKLLLLILQLLFLSKLTLMKHKIKLKLSCLTGRNLQIGDKEERCKCVKIVGSQL